MLTKKELKLIALALNKGAYENEADNAAVALIRELRKRGATIEDFMPGKPSYMARRTNVPVDIYKVVMDFGVHKGKRLEEIPLDYLEWALNNCKNMKAGLKKAISQVVNG